MNIYLASDLHIERFKTFPLPDVNADVVVLAGDIHRGNELLNIATNYQQHCQCPVIAIAGNNDYFGHDYVEQLASWKREAGSLKDISFLENNSVVIDGVRFLGCTLWSNFALYGNDQIASSQKYAQRSLDDFDVIRYDGRRFTPDDMLNEHRRSYAWLEQTLAQPFAGKTVVVTHFAPHRAAIHPAYAASQGGDDLTPYFTTDCSALMQRFPIAAWLYGHTHHSIDVIVDNGTRLISNQLGYPGERLVPSGFELNKMIEV